MTPKKLSKTTRVKNSSIVNVAEQALLRDNPSLSLTKDLTTYISKLDNRLSVPKIQKKTGGNSNHMY